MTNKEIAERMLSRLFYLMSVEHEMLVNKIEQALNEADLRSSDKWHKAGYIDGQREMRERAAKLFDHLSLSNNYFTHAARQIRSLPLEGE